MPMLDIPGDARRAFDALSSGGIAIMPMDVGYTCSGGSADALQKFLILRGGPRKSATLWLVIWKFTAKFMS